MWLAWSNWRNRGVSIVRRVAIQACDAQIHITRLSMMWSCYVSDDFDLIVRGRLVGVEGGLLGQFWEVYQRGEFPVPPM